jgi:hypothetical protein
MIAIGESVIRSVKVSKMYFAEDDDEDSGNESTATQIALIESFMQHSPTFSPSMGNSKYDNYTVNLPPISNITLINSTRSSPNASILNVPARPLSSLLTIENNNDIEQQEDNNHVEEISRTSSTPTSIDGSQDDDCPPDQRSSLHDSTSQINPDTNHQVSIHQKDEPSSISSMYPSTVAVPSQPPSYNRTYSSESTTSLPASLSFSMFSKEPVAPTTRPPISSLSRELSESGLFRSSRTHSASSSPRLSFTQQHRMLKDQTMNISVFFQPGSAPLKINLRGDIPVFKLIEIILSQYREEKRQPTLRFENPEAYDLRVLDDDDGTPDDDLPPLDRLRDFIQYGIDAVAICESVSSPATLCDTVTTTSSSFSGPKAKLSRTQSATALKTASFNSRIQLKVHVDGVRGGTDIHVLSLSADLSLSEVVALIAKKTMTHMQPEHYKFIYWSHVDEVSDYSDTASSRITVYNEQHDEQSYVGSNMVPDNDDEVEIDMRLMVSDLSGDELRLINRLEPTRRAPSFMGTSSPAMDPVPEHFIFSLESASTYSEYRVIKTNERGKRQIRVLGIDAVKIYNKHVTKNGHRRRLMEVMRAYRAIKSVSSVIIHPENALCFTIYFREKGKIISREYEAETKMECAEIVAKIRFLSNHQLKFSA